jgi:hypothetical protein
MSDSVMSGSPPLEQAGHVRPEADLDAPNLSRSRKVSLSQPTDETTTSSHHAPSTFWLAREDEVNRHLQMESSRGKDNLPEQDTMEGAAVPEQNTASGEQDLHTALTQVFPTLKDQASTKFLESLSGLGPSTSPYTFHHHSTTVSQPLTPLQGASPAGLDWGSAMPSTPKSGSLHSLQLSDVENSSDGEGNIEDRIRSSLVNSESLRLVMPSLSMPDRRPITIRGRAMGNLKICIAGAKGD